MVLRNLHGRTEPLVDDLACLALAEQGEYLCGSCNPLRVSGDCSSCQEPIDGLRRVTPGGVG
ncbi:hypothetical protein ACFSKY_21785 [Azotobacter chroococcum]|uniref:Uncharacterized protein n=1 Tax=Azotobacter chroococcum TaxID=353 RepID=A0A4R1PVL3_9GAMM|nr:hypothetical protein [Azotobacter chroococcum]TBV90396.1 hypothetical protein E0E53_22895 [Azotobacter chroococcum]TCL32124.1 hypothetical protein EV691_109120 [Azotobacter chroococcum]